MRYVIVGATLSEEKTCKEINIEVRCKRRDCGSFNNLLIAV